MTLQFRYRQQTQRLIRRVELRDSPRQSQKLARYLVDEFVRFALQTKVIFQFRYANTAENRERGRVGRVSGFREASLDLRYIPANKTPRSRSSNTTAVRYYDFGRSGWRSFRKDANVQITISAFWDPEQGQYVGSPEEASFAPGKGFDTPATDGTRESRTIGREKKRIEREQERRAQRGRDRSASEKRKEKALKRAIDR